MAYFPFFVDVEGLRCLVVGGGTVACRKVGILSEYGSDITVVSPVLIEELLEKKGEIQIIYREFEDTDLEGIDFVIAATDERAVNHRIASLCRKLGIPVNTADAKEDCSFIFPALVREGDITIGVTTGGNSPAAAKHIKECIRDVIPIGYGNLAEQLGVWRNLVKKKVPYPKARADLYKTMAAVGIEHGGILTQDKAEELIRKKLDEIHGAEDK